jgi:ATP-dependent exoDNAse (exonuclease V) alpha subunit
MPMYHIGIKSVKRSVGQTATGAAAYRSGERILDERTGKTHNHSSRKDVTHTEIFLPSQFGDAPMDWARDRTRLWNTAEAVEKRRNSRVAREFEVALPSELSADQRLALARNFAREISDRYGVAVDLALHDPKPTGDPRHFHAHLLTTTREVTPDGLGAKTGLDMQALQRLRMGLPDHGTEFVAVRERWAGLTNAAFREANIEARVDHRSLAAQGIDRQPMVHVPMEFYKHQAAGLDAGVLKQMREEYRAQIAARRAQASQHAGAESPVQRTEPPTVERGTPMEQHRRSEPEPTPAPRTVEEIRRRAVQNWLRMRSKEAESPRNDHDRQRASEVSSGRTRGEDLGK